MKTILSFLILPLSLFAQTLYYNGTNVVASVPLAAPSIVVSNDFVLAGATIYGNIVQDDNYTATFGIITGTELKGFGHYIDNTTVGMQNDGNGAIDFIYNSTPVMNIGTDSKVRIYNQLILSVPPTITNSTRSTPAFETLYTNVSGKNYLVQSVVEIFSTTTGRGSSGEVQGVLSDGTIISRCGGGIDETVVIIGTAATTNRCTLSFLVKANNGYKLHTNNFVGTLVYSITQVIEQEF